MDRAHRAPVATFHAPGAYAPGGTVTLGEDAAHHIRVRRLEAGEAVRLVDGEGGTAEGTLVRVARTHAAVELHAVGRQAALPAVHLLVPVADRDRMLWLAEKATELGVSSWRPVLWRRSKSVSPRGEGPQFREKVRARMAAALTQCGSAWLPVAYPDATPERAAAAAPAGARWLLDPAGDPAAARVPAAPLTIALGPEGGFDPAEVDLLQAAGFVRVRLGGHVLRFETAGVAALAVARAHLFAALPDDAAPTEPEETDG